jgi:hypothetical protein
MLLESYRPAGLVRFHLVLLSLILRSRVSNEILYFVAIALSADFLNKIFFCLQFPFLYCYNNQKIGASCPNIAVVLPSDVVFTFFSLTIGMERTQNLSRTSVRKPLTSTKIRFIQCFI